LRNTKEKAGKKVIVVKDEIKKKFNMESAELQKQVRDLVENQPKILPAQKIAAKEKAKVAVKSLEAVKALLNGADSKDYADTQSLLNKANSALVAEKEKEKAATQVAQASHNELLAAQKRQKEGTAKLQKLEAMLKKADDDVELGTPRPRLPWHAVVVDLGEGGLVGKMTQAERKALINKVEAAKQHLKTLNAQVHLNSIRYKEAEQARAQIHVTVAKADQTIKKLAAKAQAGLDAKKKAEVDAGAEMIANKVKVAKNKAAKKKQDEKISAKASIKHVPKNRPVWGKPCDGKQPTAASFMKALPEKSDDFKKMLQQRLASSSAAVMQLDVAKKAAYLTTCEMVANCRALGGTGTNVDTHNCHKRTMCSAGSIKAKARPCATCATLFAIKRWRELNPNDLVKCDGSTACEPTPLSWGLCTKEDQRRSPDACNTNSTDRDPAPANIFNPGQDISLGHTHCTSCFPGEALEMIHPATQTGKCRSFGPPNGTANLNSMPLCHALNNMVVEPQAASLVCTKIYRPAILYAANKSDTFLTNFNKYAYVTCNVRKMVTCEADEYGEKMPTPTKPASYAPGSLAIQQLKCKSEKQVSCANVCRVRADGQLCKRGNETDCMADRTWTAPEARLMMQSDLLGMPIDLSEYDCDPARCKAHYCHQMAIE